MAGLPRNLFCSCFVKASPPSGPPAALDTLHARVTPGEDRRVEGPLDSFPW